MDRTEEIRKEKILRKMAEDWTEMFGYEKDFITDIGWRIAQLRNDEDNYMLYVEELR